MPQDISTPSHGPWRKCCTSLTNTIDKLSALRSLLLLEIVLASQRLKSRTKGKDTPSHGSLGAVPPSWTATMGEDELGHFGYLLEKVAKQFLQGEAPDDEVVCIIVGTNVRSFNIYSSVGGVILSLSMGACRNKLRSAPTN